MKKVILLLLPLWLISCHPVPTDYINQSKQDFTVSGVNYFNYVLPDLWVENRSLSKNSLCHQRLITSDKDFLRLMRLTGKGNYINEAYLCYCAHGINQGQSFDQLVDIMIEGGELDKIEKAYGGKAKTTFIENTKGRKIYRGIVQKEGKIVMQQDVAFILHPSQSFLVQVTMGREGLRVEDSTLTNDFNQAVKAISF